MRRPSLQFYPADWQSNPKLRRCSHAEKGIWLDVICLLHDQDEYGIIRWSLKDIAQAVNAKLSALEALVSKQVLKGVDVGEMCEPFTYRPRHGGRDGGPITLIPAQDGPIWYSSRLVRDEYVRQARAASEPKPKGTPKEQPKVDIGGGIGTAIGLTSKPDPSRAGVSSSSSTSSSEASSTSEKTKASRATKPRDPRLDHPALKAVIEVKGCYPHKDTWDAVIRAVGSEPDIDRMRECWTAWRLKNFAPANLGWLMDWYRTGIPGANNNGSNQKNNQQPRGNESGFEFQPKSRVC